MAKKKSKFLHGRRIDPAPITRIPRWWIWSTNLFSPTTRRVCARLVISLRRRCSSPRSRSGLSLTGALTPAGLGISALIPLIKAGFVDWIISTGANLYHDTHFGIGLSMHQGNAQISDIVLREEEVVRIYDIFFDYSVLLDTDAFFRQIIEAPGISKNNVDRRVSLPLRPLRA